MSVAGQSQFRKHRSPRILRMCPEVRGKRTAPSTPSFGAAPPRSLSRVSMRRVLAYERQCRTLGGHSATTRRALAAMANGTPDNGAAAPAGSVSAGTHLVREWNGRTSSCAKTRPSRHRRKNCASRNQAQTLERERVTRRPPTFDCGSTHWWRRRVDRREAAINHGRSKPRNQHWIDFLRRTTTWSAQPASPKELRLSKSGSNTSTRAGYAAAANT